MSSVSILTLDFFPPGISGHIICCHRIDPIQLTPFLISICFYLITKQFLFVYYCENCLPLVCVFLLLLIFCRLHLSGLSLSQMWTNVHPVPIGKRCGILGAYDCTIYRFWKHFFFSSCRCVDVIWKVSYISHSLKVKDGGLIPKSHWTNSPGE